MALLDRLPRVSPAGYRRITLVTLLSLVAVTLAGATVRLTGSGMGCPSWPTCEPDSLTPRAEAGIHGVIELVNRLLSGVVGLTALVALYGALRLTPRRRDLVHWSGQVLAWVLLNALVGRFVIEHHLLPSTVIVHFLLAMVAIWSAVVLHHKATLAAREAEERRPTPDARSPDSPVSLFSASLLVGAALITIFLGTLVTGSGPHAGDPDAKRLSLDVGEIARIHGISAVLLVVLTLRACWSAYRNRASRALTDRLRWLTLLLTGQALIGYIQYFSGVPPVMVAAHVLGSALIWIAVLQVWLTIARPLPDRNASFDEPTLETTGTDVRNWSRCPVPQPPSR